MLYKLHVSLKVTAEAERAASRWYSNSFSVDL